MSKKKKIIWISVVLLIVIALGIGIVLMIDYIDSWRYIWGSKHPGYDGSLVVWLTHEATVEALKEPYTIENFSEIEVKSVEDEHEGRSRRVWELLNGEREPSWSDEMYSAQNYTMSLRLELKDKSREYGEKAVSILRQREDVYYVDLYVNTYGMMY